MSSEKIQSLTDIDPVLFPKEQYGSPSVETRPSIKGRLESLDQIVLPDISVTSPVQKKIEGKDAIGASVENIGCVAGLLTGSLLGAREALRGSKVPVTTGPGYPESPVPLSPPVSPEEISSKYSAYQNTKAELEKLQKLAADKGIVVPQDAVAKWKEAVEPTVTDIEAKQAGRYAAVSDTAKRVAGMDQNLFKGFQAGKDFLLPTPIASQENMMMDQLKNAVQSHHVAEKDYLKAAANWKKMADTLPKSGMNQGIEMLGKGFQYVSPLLKPIGGYMAGKDIVHAYNAGQKDDIPEAIMSGAEGLGGLLMMSGNMPTAIIGGALQMPRKLQQYSKAIEPLLAEDPRNAQFLLP
jgi:hypothetical protein